MIIKLNKFVFHMRLLDDQCLIARCDGESGVGLYGGISGYSWAVMQLRLTSSGHDFISALRDKDVWNVVTDRFKDEGISVLVDVAKELAKGFAINKVKSLTGIG